MGSDQKVWWNMIIILNGLKIESILVTNIPYIHVYLDFCLNWNPQGSFSLYISIQTMNLNFEQWKKHSLEQCQQSSRLTFSYPFNVFDLTLYFVDYIEFNTYHYSFLRMTAGDTNQLKSTTEVNTICFWSTWTS